MRTYTNWRNEGSEEQFRLAVEKSFSIAGVCKELGLAPKGGNYSTIKHHITRLGLDTSHHTGQGWNRENYQEPNARHHKTTVRARLIREHGHICWNCKLSEWMGDPIPLEMDHIDGNSQNNSTDNLRILCANCHSLTPTFRNKKRAGVKGTGLPLSLKKKGRAERPIAGSTPVTRTCECGGYMTKDAKTCKVCRVWPTVIDWPSRETVEQMVQETSYSAAGRALGVSDNAIRKYLNQAPVSVSSYKRGIIMP